MVRLLRRHTEWFAGAHVGLVMAKSLLTESICEDGENSVITGDNAADPGSTAAERGEQGDGRGIVGDVGVVGIMAVFSFCSRSLACLMVRKELSLHSIIVKSQVEFC